MNEKQKKALDLFLFYKGKITAKDIAEQINVTERTIKNWKLKFDWNVCLEKQEKKKKNIIKKIQDVEEHYPFNAENGKKGNVEGNIFQKCSEFFSEDIIFIINHIENNNIVDMLWEQILLQYATIIRMNKIMYVENREDYIQVLKKVKPTDNGEELEYAIKFGVDIYSDFQNAQSKAMGTLIALIKQYKELINELSDLKKEEYKLKIKKIEQEVDKLSNKDEEASDSELIKMLEGIKEGLKDV